MAAARELRYNSRSAVYGDLAYDLDREVRERALRLAVMVLMGYIQLTIISDEVVSLQNQLEELQTENVTLTAQHEQMFDLATVKEVAEAAGMSKPSSSQIYYIDLSEGDSAVVYQQEESNLLSRLLTSLNHGIYAVVEYFE